MAKKSIRNTMFNCKQATLLMQKKEQRRISAAERIRLFFHLLLCNPCKLFVKQSKQINHHLHELSSALPGQPTHVLPASAKERMQTLLDNTGQ